MIHSSSLSLAAVICGTAFGLAAFSGSAHAAVFASDNFTGSTPTAGATTVDNTQSAGVGTYSTAFGVGSNLGVGTVAGFGTGQSLSLGNTNNNNYRAFNSGATLTLNSLGINESLRVSFDVRFTGSFSGADNFSFGFVNTSTANSIAYANIDLNGNGTLDSEFRYRPGSQHMSDSGTTLGPTVGNNYQFASTQLASASNHTMEFSITKTSTTEFLLAYSLDGVVQGSLTLLSTSVWANSQAGVDITGVAFRHSQTPGVTTYLDNVVVETVMVPETGTSALAVAGLGVFTLLRRRRGRKLA